MEFDVEQKSVEEQILLRIFGTITQKEDHK